MQGKYLGYCQISYLFDTFSENHARDGVTNVHTNWIALISNIENRNQ